MVSGLLARCIMYVWKLNSLKENKEKFFCQVLPLEHSIQLIDRTNR